jgi:hypothetical protein
VQSTFKKHSWTAKSNCITNIVIFFFFAIIISTGLILTFTKLITQSGGSIISLHILHIPSLKHYTSTAHFTVYLFSVLCLKQIISLHALTSTEFVPSVKYITIRFLQNNFNFQFIFLSLWGYIFQVSQIKNICLKSHVDVCQQNINRRK